MSRNIVIVTENSRSPILQRSLVPAMNRYVAAGANVYLTSIERIAIGSRDDILTHYHGHIPEGDDVRAELKKKTLGNGRKWNPRYDLDGKLLPRVSDVQADTVHFRLRNLEPGSLRALRQQKIAGKLAEHFGDKGSAVLANDPRYALNFDKESFYRALEEMGAEQYTPPTVLATNPLQAIQVAERFAATNIYGKAALKAKEGFGGVGVKVLGAKTNMSELYAWVEKQINKDGVVIVQDGCDVSAGDKRIVVVANSTAPGGFEVTGCYKRMPGVDEDGSLKDLANIKAGGYRESEALTGQELEGIAAFAPEFIRRGLLVTGADTLWHKTPEDELGRRRFIELNGKSPGMMLATEEDKHAPLERLVEIDMAGNLRAA